MNLGYDIFKKLDDGSPLWVMQVATLEEAKKQLEALVRATHAAHFIRDASNGEIVAQLGPTPSA
ncbi:MAG: hypothetical protein WA734_10450 [Candidatus Acidiferrales bacterium]